MANTTYLGTPLNTSLDAATADVWGPVDNNLHAVHDAGIGRDFWPFYDKAPTDGDDRIIINARHAGTIKSVTTRSAAGTATLTVKVNTTALGGTANAVSTSEQTQAHSSSNTFVAGDDIVLTWSSVSGCSKVSGNIWFDRTTTGTA